MYWFPLQWAMENLGSQLLRLYDLLANPQMLLVIFKKKKLTPQAAL
jgi:hypothetical protein